jgi:hypothetical protein
MEKSRSDSQAKIVLPIEVDQHTLMRLKAHCSIIGADPVECASELFAMLLSDEEFDAAASQAMH